MPIDPHLLSQHMDEIAAYLGEQQGEFGKNLANALNAARAYSTPREFESFASKIEQQRGAYSWLVPTITEPLTTSSPAQPLPENYIVLAVDGSQIEVDRDSPIECYLINIGRVMIRYGESSDATIDSVPTPYYRSEDMILGGRRRPGREHAVGSSVIAARRDTAEVNALADLAESLPPDIPAIGLLDGSLTQWRAPEADNTELVEEYTKALTRLEQIAQNRTLAVASYISRPRAREVVNALRIAACPYETANCAAHCLDLQEGERPCDSVARVRDRDLFDDILTDAGDRTGVFKSTANETRDYQSHAPHFFYMRTERELARVESPQWSVGRIDLLQTLLWDQIQLGDGYPIALAEAHEAAVVRQQDRMMFQSLLEQETSRRGYTPSLSEKTSAKISRQV